MELNTIHRLRRAGQTVRTQEVKTNVPETITSSGTKSKTDTIDLTERAVAELKEQSQRIMDLFQQDREAEKLPAPWEMAEAGGEAESDMLDSLGEKLKVMERCHKIAMRIMRGDKVPPQDEQYLMQNDPEGYKLALAMRRPKRKPKEWDSVLKDDEKKAEGNDSEEAETSSCQTSEGASDSGGDAAADSE